MGVEPRNATDCNASMRPRMVGGVFIWLTPVMEATIAVPPKPSGRHTASATGKVGATASAVHDAPHNPTIEASQRNETAVKRAVASAPHTLPTLTTVSSSGYPFGSPHFWSVNFGSTTE